MNDSLRLGTVWGIRIGVHWSVILVAWLLAWGLATELLPTTAPGASPAAYWAAGIGVAIMFFTSLLAHELAHAFFARRAGIPVQGITLWLLGGVAKLEGEAPTPGHELRIAASGPLTSLGLGVGFLAASMALGASGTVPLVAESAAWLARVNLVLGVFNLLPGAPLDGGRMVKAIAWRLGRDRLRATLLATRLGRLVGFALVGFGGLELVLGANPGGIWTMVIGVFMVTSATAEREQEVARAALTGVRIREIMAPDPVRVPAGITVDVFVQGVLVAQRQQAALVIEAGGAPFGIAGVAEVTALRGHARREARVRDIAVPHGSVPVVGPDEDVLVALERIRAASSGDVPYMLVIEDGEVIGLVSPADLARSLESRAIPRRGRGAERASGSQGA
ncbi:MAG: site-2 protease family protein [Candidatus Limnocylindrales bacterium]